MIEVSPIPAFDDNYIWLLTRPGTHACAVVDPGDEDPVIERLQASGLELRAILITHKHGDHVGGIRGLKERWPGAVVYGPAGEPIKSLERRLHGGDRITLNDLGVTFDVLDVPGHTEGHIAYHDANDGMLFCGDTLFAAGCGRVFSGTFEQLSDSLVRIGRLPPRTRLYCAHEYTLSNLKFALAVDPDNQDLQQRNASCMKLREKDISTVPFTLAEDLKTNPFLRSQSPAIIAAAKNRASTEDPVSVFAAIRAWKDNF